MKFSPSVVALAAVTLTSSHKYFQEVSAFSLQGMKTTPPALISALAGSSQKHAVSSHVKRSFGISTSLSSLETSMDITNETPELDDGETPTEDEIEMIKSIRKKEFVPDDKALGLISDTFQFFKRAKKGQQEEESNEELFDFLIDKVIGGSPKFNGVNLQDDITFTSKTRELLWGFEVKDDIIKQLGILLYAYPTLKHLPALNTNIDTDLMTQDDYDNLSKGFIDAHDVQMKVKNPEQCFLKNAPAFCKPRGDGTSICNLDYLAKYQVRKGTPFRYGGLAVVKDGKIIEVSGVRESDGDDFEVKKAVFFNSFAVHVVLVRHAVMGHLALYQRNLMKLTAKRSEEYQDLWKSSLGPELLMKALTPNGTNEVNTNIQLLIGPGNSLVGRATSLTNDAITLLNSNAYDKYVAMKPDEIIADIGGDGSEGWENACKNAWKAAKKAVNKICRDIEDSEHLEKDDLESLALLLWTGTFYHGFIGDFQLDNVVKGNLPFLITGKPHVQTKAYGTLSATIGISTMTRTMNMATLGTYFPEKYQRKAWEAYQEKLKECRKETGIEGFADDTAVYNAIDF